MCTVNRCSLRDTFRSRSYSDNNVEIADGGHVVIADDACKSFFFKPQLLNGMKKLFYVGGGESRQITRFQCILLTAFE